MQIGVIEMDLSSNHIISSEFNVDSQPDQPAENITFMDVALYKAAVRGKIEEFNDYQGFELESIRALDHDTVLHVYLEAKNPSDVFHSDFVFIREILKKCPSLLLQANAKGQTPLHIAARYGHSAVVKFLINHAKAPHGDVENPGMDQLEAVRELLRKTDLESNTALHVAAQYGQVRVVRELLEFEDPDFPYPVNRNQETPVYLAARRGDGPLLTMILDKLKSTAHGGPHGRTTLHAAAMAGVADAIRVTLEKSENLTLQTDENGQTPLHYAAHLGHYSVVKELLKWDECAAYIADKKWEMTPLLMAARQGHEEIVEEFISCCPDCCGKVDKRGWNFLHFVDIRHSPSYFLRLYGGSNPVYGSIGELLDAKDVHGITPRQVYAAFLSRRRVLPGSFNNNQLMMKRELIVKLLEDIENGEVAEAAVSPIPMQCAAADSIAKVRDGHLVVATLIATVTFAAAIAVPRGYKTDKGSDQGTPFLIRDAAFQAFVISDALAFIFSLVAVAIHFRMRPPFISNRYVALTLKLASAFISYAVWAIVIAFSIGSYAVLKPSPGLAITSCCIGLSFFYMVFANRIILMIQKARFIILKRNQWK